MTQTPLPIKPVIIWEKLAEDYILPDEPVESILQPLLASALTESLDLAGLLTPVMLIATNMGICTKVDGKTVIKAPDWFYVPSVHPTLAGEIRRSYTPHAEGDVPAIVMEFLSDTDGGEYSLRHFYPYGKLWFYERILQAPFYIIFNPNQPLLEVRYLRNERYELLIPDSEGRYFIPTLNLFLGSWYGKRQEMSVYWLRWWDREGNLLLWGSERIVIEQQAVERERKRTEQERKRTEQEKQRGDRLARRLREMGINPDEVS